MGNELRIAFWVMRFHGFQSTGLSPSKTNSTKTLMKVEKAARVRSQKVRLRHGIFAVAFCYAVLPRK
jgi:hypothetical protein